MTPLAPVLLATTALLGGFLLAPAQAHDIYSEWKIPGTEHSCCSDRDCYPVEAKFENGHWHAQRREDGVWLTIPDQAVLKDGATADGKAHLCAPPPYSPEDTRIYCFRPPWSGG